MNVYRVVVEHWPTEDGRPWKRFYRVTDDPQHWETPVPAWLDMERVPPERLRNDGYDAFNPTGVVMPNPKRRHWFSRSAAEAWARDARALGADVRVERSEPVQWPEADR